MCVCFDGPLCLQCVSRPDPDGPGEKGLLPMSALPAVFPRHPRGGHLRLPQDLHQVRLARLSLSSINGQSLGTVTVTSGTSAPWPCSSPDDQLDQVALEPDSVSFMEALLAHGQVPLQNGLQGEHAEAPEGGGTAATPGGEKSSTTPGLTCPVTLNKAVLLYPEVHSQWFLCL